MKKRFDVVVIGDCHGAYLTFQAMLKQLPDEEIFITGDVVDRGPRSKDILDFLVAHPEIKSVLGNHEHLAIGSFSDSFDSRYYRQDWLANGGYQTMLSYGLEVVDFEFPPEHMEYMKKLPLYIEKDGVFISHSLIFHSLEAATASLDSNQSIIWARYGTTKRVNKCFHVFGHTPVKEPLMRKHWCCIDCGAAYPKHGGYLAAIQYPSKKIFKQEYVD